MVLICKCPLLAVKIGFALISLRLSAYGQLKCHVIGNVNNENGVVGSACAFLHFTLLFSNFLHINMIPTSTQQHNAMRTTRRGELLFFIIERGKKSRILLSTRVLSLRDAKFICFHEGVCAERQMPLITRGSQTHDCNGETQCIWFFSRFFICFLVRL